MTNLTDDRPYPAEISREEAERPRDDDPKFGGIEATIERCDAGLVPSCGTAFSLDGAIRDRLVVVHEAAADFLPDAEATRIVDAIRRALLDQHGLKVDAVALIKPGSIPRTMSGEVDQQACRTRFLDGSLSASLCGSEESTTAEVKAADDSLPRFSDPIGMLEAEHEPPAAIDAITGGDAEQAGPDLVEAAQNAESPLAIDFKKQSLSRSIPDDSPEQTAPAAPNIGDESRDSATTAAPRRRRFRFSLLLRRRSDGTLVEDESPSRLILPYVIGRRSEALAFHESNYDLSQTLPWLRAYNKRVEGHKATLFDLFLWALARTAHKRPGMNRFVSARRLYQRNKVSCSFAAKTKLDVGAPVVNIKLDFPAGEPFAECAQRIAATIRQRRSGPPSEAEWEANVLMRLPRFLIRAALGCYRWLDWLNLLPRRFIEADPLFTSAYVANLGSLGLDSAYHHLYACGTCSLFAVLGAPRKMLFVHPDGTQHVHDGLPVRWTVDTRIADGHYNAVCLRMVQAIVEDPERFCVPDGSELPAELHVA